MNSWYAVAQDGELVGMFDKNLSRAGEADLIEEAIYQVASDVVLCAEAGSALHQVLSQFQKLGIDPAHPDKCTEEAAALMRAPGLDDPTLQDLESIAFVTIDNADSRDLDQALYLEATAAGSRVLYALADAAYYVRPGSALFTEALLRGVTYYAPGMAAPMLPPALSEGLISLNPDVLRRALVFDISLDNAGEVCSTAVYQARIRSRAKISYDGVQAWLDGRARGESHDWDQLPFARSLAQMVVVGEQRMALARERNVVEHNRREAQMSIDPEDNSKFRLRMRDRNDVERYNEQISLLCNMEGAQLLLRQQKLSDDLQAVFRVHLPPIAERLQKLQRALDAICDAHDLQDPWRWDGEQLLADYLESLPVDAIYARLRQAVGRQIMLINHASEFSAEPGPHHALGVDGYARFSSPMREIAGIFTHKEFLEAQGTIKALDVSEDELLREQVIAVANKAKKVQRRLQKGFQLHIIEQYLRDDLALPLQQRPLRDATVMGMRGTRIYLAVDGLALDLKLYAGDLERHWACRYEVSDIDAIPSDQSAPSLRVGDRAKLRVGSWDDKRNRFILELVPRSRD